jgi:phosphoglycolate phosphatase-like HAD superfamily hydrolase
MSSFRGIPMNVKPHQHLTTAMKGLMLWDRDRHVGDHILDIQAGKRGAKTIMLTGSKTKEDFEQAGADFVLDDASGLCALLVK